MKLNASIILLLALFSGCTGAQIGQFADSAANAKYVIRRVSGVSYFKFNRTDSHDSYNAANGYLCVSHDPNCGVQGNDGKDIFFNTMLPPLCSIVECDFVQFWPTDVPSSYSFTGKVPQSYGLIFTKGTANTTQPYTVRYYNTCSGPFGGEKLQYRISFLVRMPEHIAFGEDTTASTAPGVNICVPAGFAEQKTPDPLPQTTSPSGFAGQVLYCNGTNQVANGVLQLRAKVLTPNPGAMGQDTMILNIKVKFDPGAGQPSKCAFVTATHYKQGTWQITQAGLLGLTNAKSIGPLPKIVSLPGALTTPILDFTGGNGCSIIQ